MAAIGTLEVTLLAAKDLKRTDFLGKIDPYVVIKYKNQQHTSSIARGGGNMPEWNEKFKFSIQYSRKANYVVKSQDTLSLTIMDHDTFSDDDYLGETTIYLKELIEAGVEKGKAELGAQKYRVVLKDKAYHGEIHVGITFTLKKESKQEFGGWKQSQPF